MLAALLVSQNCPAATRGPSDRPTPADPGPSAAASSDLVVDEFSVSQGSTIIRSSRPKGRAPDFQKGKPITLTARVTNHGSIAMLHPPSIYTFCSDDTSAGAQSMVCQPPNLDGKGSLVPGQSQTLTGTMTLEMATRYEIAADVRPHQPAERWPLSLAFRVVDSSQPTAADFAQVKVEDLVAIQGNMTFHRGTTSQPTGEPFNFKAGEAMTFKMRIANHGTKTMPARYAFISKDQGCDVFGDPTEQQGGIPAGQSITVATSATFAAGVTCLIYGVYNPSMAPFAPDDMRVWIQVH